MRITPVVKQSNTVNNQTFSGLWGKTKRRTDIDEGLNIPSITETYFYYPFSDETEQQIRQIQKETNKEYIENKNGSDKLYKYRFKRCRKLPFTMNEFTNYYLNSNLDKNSKIIHQYAQNLYTTKGFEIEQIPAFNDDVETLLDECV